jgi:MYXO-CTERM domain-containing protein
MQRNSLRTWLYSATIAAAIGAAPVMTPLHAQNPSDQGAATNTNDRDGDRSNLGWLGLLGLVGLLGMRRRHDERDTTVRARPTGTTGTSGTSRPTT